MDFVNALKASSRAATAAPRKVWRKHDSGILTAVTIVSSGLAVYFALKDGPKAKKILDQKREEGASNVEKAKAVLPVCGRTMMAIAVAWGSSLLNHKRMTGKVSTLVEALSLARSIQSDRIEAEKEVLGEEKAAEIDKKIDQRRATEKPVVLSEIETTGHGTYIFREPLTGKTIRCSKDYIELIVGRFSSELYRMHKGIQNGDLDPDAEELEVSMNDIFKALGLSGCEFAEFLVWPARDFDSIDVNLNETFEYEGPDGTLEPAYILKFYTRPIIGYNSYMYGYGGRY